MLDRLIVGSGVSGGNAALAYFAINRPELIVENGEKGWERMYSTLPIVALKRRIMCRVMGYRYPAMSAGFLSQISIPVLTEKRVMRLVPLSLISHIML